MTPRSNSNRSTAQMPNGRRPMSNQHKKALAQGREQGRAIRRYLDALARQKPRRGRRRTVESANRQLRETVDQLATARSLARVELLQRRIDLEAEIAALGEGGGSDLSELEAGFVAAALNVREVAQESEEDGFDEVPIFGTTGEEGSELEDAALKTINVDDGEVAAT